MIFDVYRNIHTNDLFAVNRSDPSLFLGYPVAQGVYASSEEEAIAIFEEDPGAWN